MYDAILTLLVIKSENKRSFHEGNLDDLLRAFIPEGVKPLPEDRDLIYDIEGTHFWFRKLNTPITPSFKKDLERFIQYGGLIRGMYFHTKPIPMEKRRNL